MIKNLNDDQLLLEIKSLAKEETRMTQLILDYLAEVETRRLFALRGYPSLFEFCVKELGYSESSAFRRISAMRAIKSIPEAKAKLENGTVNLSTLTQLQSFIKSEEKLGGVKLEPDAKKNLLSKIENKSQKQCEREFAKISPEIIKTKESERIVAKNLTEYKFMASSELVQKLNQLRNLLSHRDVESMAGLIEELADIALKKHLPSKKQASTFAAEVQNDTTKKGARYIPSALRRMVWHRDAGKCQYVDPLTAKKCESKFRIQFDHLMPVSKGGQTTEKNLRLLCFSHNQIEAINHFSKKHMEKFISPLQ
jgi:hypothetical protein